MTTFRRPRGLTAGDPVSRFDCGEPSLNEWLRGRALKNETTGASRTFVSIEGDSGEIAGYYCLSASALAPESAPGRIRRNMPTPIPVILIGRLAVDLRHGGRGLGASLLRDAVVKGIEASRIIGARAFIVDALNDAAANFYRRYGFEPVPPDSERAMYLLVADAEATVAELD